MKKLSKVLALAAALCIIIACMAGCGGSAKYADSPYLGKWVGTTAEYAGMEFSVEDILGGEFSFTLNDNGKCDVVVADETGSGTWEPTDDGIHIEEGSDEFDFTSASDTTLTLDYDGVNFTFEKE